MNRVYFSSLTFSQIVLHGRTRQNDPTLRPNSVDSFARGRPQIFDSMTLVQYDQVGTFRK